MKLSGQNQLNDLVVLLDENSTWKPHITYIENKIAKSIGLLFKAKPFLNKQSLLSLYYSDIHSYINCTNVAWGSTYMTNLEKLSSQQKHLMRIVCNKGKFEHSKELFQLNKILNVYKLNILNVATFMHKVNTKSAPNIFLSRFQKPSHSYPARFLELNYVQPNYNNSIRGSYIWNSFLSSEEKQITIINT